MSKKNLVIVESPAKAKTIGKYLGPDYQVTACMGHLRDLPKSTLGVDIEHDFEPEYKPIRGKEELIRQLKKDAAASDTVSAHTDATVSILPPPFVMNFGLCPSTLPPRGAQSFPPACNRAKKRTKALPAA